MCLFAMSWQDPTGEVDGYFHRELVEYLGPALVSGVGILLHKVSVFTPTDAPVTGRRKSYLNITPRNVRRVFVKEDSTNGMKIDSIVESFNNELEVKSLQENDKDDYEDDQASRSEQAAHQLLQHKTVRDTSAELTFLSQRQVIHRNPPVRADSAVATVATKKKGKRGKSAAVNKGQDHDNGLGKWQWSKLLKKTSSDNEIESAAGSSRVHERQGFLHASSRLASLIIKQKEQAQTQTRYATTAIIVSVCSDGSFATCSNEKAKQPTSPAIVGNSKKSVNVHFASDTSMCHPPPRILCENDKGQGSLSPFSPPLRKNLATSSGSRNRTNPDTLSDDEDDDW